MFSCWVFMTAFLLFCGLLLHLSAACRYYSKFILFIVISLIAATIPIPLMLLRPRSPKNALFPAWALRQCTKFLGLKFHVRGHENIVQDTTNGKENGCVVLINHQSALDLIVLAELWPIMPRCSVISKKEIFWLGPFGLATWLWGTVFIDRRDGGSAKATVNAAGNAIKNRGSRILMFPEGTRNEKSELLPFKKGAFHIAIDSKCSIQPVVVSNYYFLESRTKKFQPGEILIEILPPISTSGVNRDDLPKLVDSVRDIMSEKYKILTNEITTLNNNKLKTY